MRTLDTQTPKELAKKLVEIIMYDYTLGDRFYEPFRGDGAFYNAMPEPKDWAEINMGRDFFTYLPFNGHCEYIITNPPFRINGKNSFILSLERSFEIATKAIGLLINHTMMNSLTPIRLEKYKQNGWVITMLHIVNIKKWYGRYWFVVFKKDGNSIITWDLNNYGD